jgi:hypothetical protein
MAGVTRIPRSRGGVSGVLLILLGAWGGLAPFVGPYFGFAYTPDKAWAYTSGRLWLSIVPGAAALIGGLLVTVASHRAVGIVGAVLAALGGAWFIVGSTVTKVVVVSPSISAGAPLARTVGSISVAKWQFFEGLGFFTATGILILFFAALALGRFSVVGVRDAALADAEEPSLAAGGYPSAYSAPDSTRQDAAFPATAGEFPTTTGEFPGSGGHYSPSGQYPPAGQAPTEQLPAEAEQAGPAQTTPEGFPTTTSPFRNPSESDTGPLRGPGSS